MIKCKPIIHIILVAIVLIFGAFAVSMWLPRDGGTKLYNIANTRYTLQMLTVDVCITSRGNIDSIPDSLPAIVNWLVETNPSWKYTNEGFSAENYTVYDEWGNDLVVLKDSNQVVGFGSSGPNAIWEQGANDDLAVYLQDIINEHPDVFRDNKKGQ
ncbi:MAG: hypothetical protein IT445_15120 [Phycisphaeraceae bacterium]|nr:hypothetical protein [Phycisphaeraceae bacterium]